MSGKITPQLLQQLCSAGKIRWTNHSTARIQARGIDPSDIRQCLLACEVIEDYPDDYPHPSCLVFGLTVAGVQMHLVAGISDLDTFDAQIWVITAYFPDKNKWDESFKKRKVASQ